MSARQPVPTADPDASRNGDDEADLDDDIHSEEERRQYDDLVARRMCFRMLCSDMYVVPLLIFLVAVAAVISIWAVRETEAAVAAAAAGGTNPGGSNFASCESEIWVIRHGEREGAGASLNQIGLRRALHLRDMVRSGEWPRFSAVFAASPLKNAASAHLKGMKNSWHMYELVLPLSSEIGVHVNISAGQTEYSGIADGMLDAAREHCGGTVLVAWDHCQLSSILQAAGCDLEVCRRCWPDVWFDTVYKVKVRFTPSGGATFVKAWMGAEGFDGHLDTTNWPVSKKGLYDGVLGYYHCERENRPWAYPCLYGDDLENVCPVWGGANNPYHKFNEEQAQKAAKDNEPKVAAADEGEAPKEDGSKEESGGGKNRLRLRQ